MFKFKATDPNGQSITLRTKPVLIRMKIRASLGQYLPRPAKILTDDGCEMTRLEKSLYEHPVTKVRYRSDDPLAP